MVLRVATADDLRAAVLSDAPGNVIVALESDASLDAAHHLWRFVSTRRADGQQARWAGVTRLLDKSRLYDFLRRRLDYLCTWHDQVAMQLDEVDQGLRELEEHPAIQANGAALSDWPLDDLHLYVTIPPLQDEPLEDESEVEVDVDEEGSPLVPKGPNELIRDKSGFRPAATSSTRADLMRLEVSMIHQAEDVDPRAQAALRQFNFKYLIHKKECLEMLKYRLRSAVSDLEGVLTERTLIGSGHTDLSEFKDTEDGNLFHN